MKTYQIWNKKDDIKGQNAEYWKDSLGLSENDGVFLILNNDVIEYVEVDTIIKGNYNLDTELTTEQVAQRYLEIKEQEMEQSQQYHLTLEEQGEKITYLERDQSKQDEKILTTMLATTQIFEMMLTLSPPEGVDINIKTLGGNSMIELYATLVIEGAKTIEQVPALIRDQVRALVEKLTTVKN